MKTESLIGKTCTIFTTTINQAYQAFGKQIFSYFVGTVEEVDRLGIMMVNKAGRSNFYFFPNIVSIHEEEVMELDPSNPEHARIIKEMEEQEKKIMQPKQEMKKPVVQKAQPVVEVNNSPFVGIDAIQALAQRAKQSFDAKKS